jgi:homocysteine S-methyltransferase
LTESQVVRDVSRSYKKAGATFLKTNTFNALAPKLIKNGIQDQHEAILKKACELAKEVACEDTFVLGTMGPLGVVLEPLGPTSLQEAQDYFKQNAKVFITEKVDAILLTSFHDLHELECGIQAVQQLDSNFPIFAQLAIQENMKTSFGHSLEEFVKLADKYNIPVLGISGEVGPSGSLTATQILRQLTSKTLYVSPNAGLPRYVNDEYIYMCNPDYMGKYAKRLVEAGANIVGGHSGVHEEHILAISNSLKMAKGRNSQTQNGSSLDEITDVSYRLQMPKILQTLKDAPKECVQIRERSQWGRYLDSGKKVVTVEVLPPNGVDIEKFLSHCEELVENGVRFMNIPDGARAVARMSSIHLASKIKNLFPIEPIPHVTTRDRNLIGLQSELLGAYVNGIRNLLLVTGDPPKLGNCPGATAVYDVDAIGLTHVVNRMNQGLDLGGSAFGKPSEFVIGVALNPTASNKELEIKRFNYKIEAGANYAITQPIYSLQAYKEFFDELGEVKIPIVMGIWPLVSLRNAEFLKNEVPGVEVPDWVIDEMKKAKGDKDEALKRGLDIAIKTMQEAQNLVAGFQVSAPFNRVDVATQLIHQALGKLT